MYNLPEQFGSKDYRKPVDLVGVDRLPKKYTKEPQLYDPLFAEVAHSLVPDLTTPTNTYKALQLYKKLLGRCWMARTLHLVHIPVTIQADDNEHYLGLGTTVSNSSSGD
ncbi:hypothetical protein QAD02_003587 [Eretmocerus hayati]|uniref:Uncharacterized protein n=1 Tax=Eretmocerus hayati TaxID=131215 RepID=A0ACC2NN77_9HYME|nr:hypothetical protein QAD02_003587 [Eretmocerus hayati]